MCEVQLAVDTLSSKRQGGVVSVPPPFAKNKNVWANFTSQIRLREKVPRKLKFDAFCSDFIAKTVFSVKKEPVYRFLLE